MGVPAHITVLYPFIRPNQLTTSIITEVETAVTGVSAFECTFANVNWFGEDVVWLEPEPDRYFSALMRAVWARFPDHPPYGDPLLEPRPHLTIGAGPTADLTSMRRAATEIRAALPIAASINRVQLIAGSDAPRSWRTLAEFSLPPA